MNYNAYLVEIRAKFSAGLGSKEKPKKWYFRCFARAKNGARVIKRKEGEGEGKEEKKIILSHAHTAIFNFQFSVSILK